MRRFRRVLVFEAQQNQKGQEECGAGQEDEHYGKGATDQCLILLSERLEPLAQGFVRRTDNHKGLGVGLVHDPL